MIRLTTEELHKRDCTTIQAEGDTDVSIVETAVLSSNFRKTSLIGEDTDLLVLLVYHTCLDNCKGLFFRSGKRNGSNLIYDIAAIKKTLGHETCSRLLFLHAFTGCDTTSRIYEVGKKGAFSKLIAGQEAIVRAADAFLKTSQSLECLSRSGNRAMIAFCGGKSPENLTSLRHRMLIKKTSRGSTFVGPEQLPPTENAIVYHSLRTYHQIMAWIKEDLDPLEFGWATHNNQLVPTMASAPPVPEELLNIVCCNCRTTRCTCRRYGLPCTEGCGRGQENNYDNPIQQH